MTHGNTPATSAARLLRSACGFLGYSPTCQKSAAATSGPAMNTAPTPSEDERLRLMCIRERLASDLRHARQRHKATCLIEADLRRVTTQLLGGRS